MELIAGALLVLACFELFAALEIRAFRRGALDIEARAKNRQVDLRAEMTGWFRTLEGAVMDLNAQWQKDAAALMEEDTRTAQALRGVWNRLEALPKLEEGVDTLLARDEAGEVVKQLEALLKQSPETLSRDEEIRLSNAMEEGVSNLLQYAAGRVPGVEVRL